MFSHYRTPCSRLAAWEPHLPHGFSRLYFANIQTQGALAACCPLIFIVNRSGTDRCATVSVMTCQWFQTRLVLFAGQIRNSELSKESTIFCVCVESPHTLQGKTSVTSSDSIFLPAYSGLFRAICDSTEDKNTFCIGVPLLSNLRWLWLPSEKEADDAALWPTGWPEANEAIEANLVSRGQIPTSVHGGVSMFLTPTGSLIFSKQRATIKWDKSLPAKVHLQLFRYASISI